MNYPYPTYFTAQASTLVSEKRRQHFIAAAISFKNGITTEVAPAQRHVFSQFALGRLTIDEVVYYLEATAPAEVIGR